MIPHIENAQGGGVTTNLYLSLVDLAVFTPIVPFISNAKIYAIIEILS